MRAGRWGDVFVDDRDWGAYNEELVVRGNFYLDVDWVESWDRELEEMNRGKRGSPFEFPWSLIRLQGVWHQWVDYRGVEGITRKLAGYGLIPEFNDFSTINRRVNKIDLDFQLPREGEVDVSTDGTSTKMCNGGSHRERKYGRIESLNFYFLSLVKFSNLRLRKTTELAIVTKNPPKIPPITNPPIKTVILGSSTINPITTPRIMDIPITWSLWLRVYSPTTLNTNIIMPKIRRINKSDPNNLNRFNDKFPTSENIPILNERNVMPIYKFSSYF